jgi:predicted ATPase/DNA-binding CsgD family transcriptional regulator/Tfp pilus assembly protein PilF
MMVVHNLPHAAAPFVNRVSEIAEIAHRLNDADCRLLTLVGPGGIGKTRLAVRAAADCVDQFDNGIFFVPLQPLDSPEFIISAIADALGFQFGLSGDLKQQLFQYLREKTLLLLLDNFEHLLGGVVLLTEILDAAPGIKLIVTSREVLNLQEEWLYSVHGLPYPKTEDVEQPGAYSAIQLFVERARRVRGDLSLADEQAGVIRICQLVEGMPLALELASTWTKTLQTDEIATEIQRSIDFLSTSVRNVPERHQSMQAVFEQTWQRLSDGERRVFSALSVFSGGFRREAAEAVAGVSLRILSGLGDKSLLTHEPNGRYQIHELLRQYAQTRLETTPDEAFRIHDLHCAYYARFLHERQQSLAGSSRQRDASLEIEADLDNVRAAWAWAVEHSKVEAVEQAQYALIMFSAIQGRFVEAKGAFEKAVRMLDNGDPRTEFLLARVLCSLGASYSYGGSLEQAESTLERSWRLYVQHIDLSAPGLEHIDPRLILAYVYLLQGRNFDRAEQITREAIQDNLVRQDYFNLTNAGIVLTIVARIQGKHKEASQYVQQAYEYTVITGDLYQRSSILSELAAISLIFGSTADAKRHFQAAYAIQLDLKIYRGLPETLTSLGRIALLEGDYAEARRSYEQARSIAHDWGNPIGLAAALEGLGDSTRAMSHYGEARRYLREALQISSPHMVSRTLSIFVGIGDLFLQTEQRTRGIELLAFALQHPNSDQETKDRAQRLLSRYQVTEAVLRQIPTNVEFDAVANTLLEELSIPEAEAIPNHPQRADETLIESLSERELAVLILIADGRPNREIADKLFLSVATVKWYLTHIYSKLGVQSRTQAVIRARQLNLLP